MENKIITTLKQFHWTCVLIFIYYIAYNSYFGFNKHALSKAEEICDDITKGLVGVAIGLFLIALTSFMKLVVVFVQKQMEN
jgi:hypothetical protein